MQRDEKSGLLRRNCAGKLLRRRRKKQRLSSPRKKEKSSGHASAPRDRQTTQTLRRRREHSIYLSVTKREHEEERNVERRTGKRVCLRKIMADSQKQMNCYTFFLLSLSLSPFLSAASSVPTRPPPNRTRKEPRAQRAKVRRVRYELLERVRLPTERDLSESVVVYFEPCSTKPLAPLLLSLILSLRSGAPLEAVILL